MKSGDLGYLCTQSGGNFNAAGICSISADQLYNPFNGTPYVNDVITGINPASTAFLQFYPSPNVGSTFTSDNYRTNVPANLSSNGFDVRGDQYFGQKLFVTGRFTFKNIPQLSPEELTIPSSTYYEHVRMLVASGTYASRPTLLNEFRFGLTNDLSGTQNPYNGKPFTEGLGFADINDLWYNGLPEVDFSGETTGLTVDRLNSVGQSRTYGFTESLSWVIGGWQTNNVLTIHSGAFLTPYFTSGDPSGTGSGIIGRAQRPDRVGSLVPSQKNAGERILGSGLACPGGSCSIGEGGSSLPPIGRFGTSGVGILTGPGTIDWDTGLSKSFNLTERVKLRFEVSFVNVMNHLNLGDPDLKITDLNNPSAQLCGLGCITSAQGLFEFAGARQGQASLRIDF
jgi:hypothetical protein